MKTIYTAIAILGMTALFGMYLLSLVLRNKETPKGVAMIHGTFAVIGLVLLIVYCTGNKSGPLVSIVVFSMAAFGGLIMFYIKSTGKKIPKWLGIAHGLTAVIGFSLLIWFACC